MELRILYFARLREALGCAQETVSVPPGIQTLGQLRIWMTTRGEPWAQAFTQIQPLRSALDHELAGDEARLRAGAEVAFFPPVTGG